MVFLTTYKNTLKTLLRSAIIWLCVMIVVFLVFQPATQVNYGYTIVENNEIIKHVVDTDPEFELSYNNFIQVILGATRGWVMMYAIPLFCVVSTIILLSGDFRNGFFEVEKANDIKPYKYFFGRLTALLSISVILCLICTFSSISYYYFSRGGVSGYPVTSFLRTTAINVFRTFLGAMLPAILFFIGLTYMSVNLFKSGFAGGLIGFGYILLEYGTKSFLIMRFPKYYHRYLTPKPDKLYIYFTYYDNPELSAPIPDRFAANDVLISLSVIAIVSLLCYVVSYICLKKREI